MEMILTVKIANSDEYYQYYKNATNLYRLHTLGYGDNETVILENKEAFIEWCREWNSIVIPDNVSISLDKQSTN